MAKYRSEKPCVSCNWFAENEVCFHHLYGRKAHGTINEEWNLLPVCQRCHNEVHNVGLTTFASENIWVEEWLLNHGWQFDKFLEKWIHEKDEVWALRKSKKLPGNGESKKSK